MTDSSFTSIKLSPELHTFLKRRINFHRVLWVLTAVVFFIAWNRGLSLLYGLFSLLAALLMLSYLLPHRQLRHIRVSRLFISDLAAGKPGSITYQLAIHGVRYHVELIESLEFAENKEAHIFFSKISGRTTWKLHFNCLQRGCFWLRGCRLSSAYPFGIFKLCRHIQTEPMEILVFPRVVELPRMPMPFMADTTTWGDMHLPQKGGRDEFTSVREYSHGDELNRIHWAVSARHQNLVVKLYEKTDRPSLLVVLDCQRKFNVGEGHRSTFEFAVSIAASMILYATRQGIQCFLATRGDQVHELTIQAYCKDLYTLYAFLARLNCDGLQPYPPVVEQAHRRFAQANLVTTFRLDSDTTHPALSPQVTHIEMEMDEKSFRSPTQPSTQKGLRQEGNRLIYSVQADRQLEEIFQ